MIYFQKDVLNLFHKHVEIKLNSQFENQQWRQQSARAESDDYL